MTPRHTVARAAVLGIALLAGRCGPAAAADGDAQTQDLRLSGFGTIGLARVNATAGAGFRRDSFERANDGGFRADIDTRLGVQANFRASSQFEFVGQLLGANRISGAAPSDAVSLAFVAWRPQDDVTLRVGRLSTDYFLMADYRNVGFAYPFVRPPTETYASLPYSLDGADLTKSWHMDEAIWKLRGIVGRSLSISDQPSDTVALHPAYTLVVSREDSDGLLLKASASRIRLHTDRAAAQPLIDALHQIGALPVDAVASQANSYADTIDIDRRWVTYYSFGAVLDRDDWLLNIEISRCTIANDPYSTAWGIVGRRWGALTAYGGLSGVRTQLSRVPPQWAATLTPLIGAAAAAQAQQVGTFGFNAASTSNTTQRTVTLGIRWDVSERAALKLQWDRVRVDAHAGRLWSSGPTPNAIRANIGSMTLDFVF